MGIKQITRWIDNMKKRQLKSGSRDIILTGTENSPLYGNENIKYFLHLGLIYHLSFFFTLAFFSFQ